jgi:hypothetical protein
VKREGTAEVIVLAEGRSLGPRAFVVDTTESGLAVADVTIDVTPAEAVMFERDAATLRLMLDDMRIDVIVSRLNAETNSVEFAVQRVELGGGLVG